MMIQLKKNYLLLWVLRVVMVPIVLILYAAGLILQLLFGLCTAVGSGVAVLSAAGADTADGLLSAKTSAEFAGAEQAVSIRTARANIHFFIRIPHILYRQVYRAVAAASRIPPVQNKSCGTP